MSDETENSDILTLESALTGNDTHSQWEACDELRCRFLQAWHEKQGQKHSTSAHRRCELIRSLLKRMCYRGDAGLNDTIVTAMMEHIFQTPEILLFFGDWNKDALLKPIYTDARYIATGIKDLPGSKRDELGTKHCHSPARR